jgi:FKBP-type peptidyl-prolyl cis-trans isomerase
MKQFMHFPFFILNKMILKYPIIILVLVVVQSLSAHSQQTFRKTKSGLKYIFFNENNQHRNIIKGDVILYQLTLKNDVDSVVIDTKKEFGEQQLEITKSEFRGDLMEALKLAHEGDSALFLISTNKLYKKNIPFFAHKNTYMKFYFKINHVFTKTELQQHLTMTFDQQIKIDDSILNNYFTTSKNIPQRIKPGLYVDLKEKGIGGDLRKGDSIKVNYTGKLINGEIFDSNTEKRFGHVEPFKFVAGVGNVIKGWDEALMLMQRGGKATFYIASPYAYGSKKMGAIPANSILIFDVEVLKK